MKTLLTTLFTLFLFNNAYACVTLGTIKHVVKDMVSISFPSPKKCSNFLYTRPNIEISNNLASKYGECINSHLSKIVGKHVDGKVKHFPSSRYIGMNIKVTDISRIEGFNNDNNTFDIKMGHSIESLSNDDNPFEWYASLEDNYNSINASKYLGWRTEISRDECPGIKF
ncbi:MAG: hypothetical protein NZ735_07300 [Candidatus Marinimicrobia bacterium]|nr:hypothetical protein [Candidatus Neomarinimicrobiota bacterium]